LYENSDTGVFVCFTPKALHNSAQGSTLGKKVRHRSYPDRVEYDFVDRFDYFTLSG
jgi:hypothetical protein